MTDLTTVHAPDLTVTSDLDHYGCSRHPDRTLCGMDTADLDFLGVTDEVSCVVCTDLEASTPDHLCIIDGRPCEC